MEMDIVFKIAGIGIITSLVCQVLNRTGREDIATLAALAGLVIVIMMVVALLSDFMGTLRGVFMLG